MAVLYPGSHHGSALSRKPESPHGLKSGHETIVDAINGSQLLLPTQAVLTRSKQNNKHRAMAIALFYCFIFNYEYAFQKVNFKVWL